jgi:multiple sugar transport system ATP-binding protein
VVGLIVKGVSKAFGKTEVLSRVSFELEEGELLVLLGPSGCGKTTLLRLIAGLETADSGEIYIGARRVDGLRPRQRRVAMVFQNYSLYPHMTVEKNLSFPLRVASVEKAEIRARVQRVAAMLGLTEKLGERPASLSGGQRQRVALGRAIIREPELFLLDEPLSNLDADLRARMRREIVRVQKELGVSTVYVTHDQAEALTMADRIALIHHGRIVQIGRPQEVYEDPVNRFAAEFVGWPKMNIIEARIERHLLIPFGLSMLNLELARDEARLLVGLRPEAIEIRPDGEFAAAVEHVEYLGDQFVATLDFKGMPLIAANVTKKHRRGQAVNFTFDAGKLLYFHPETGERLGGQR